MSWKGNTVKRAGEIFFRLFNERGSMVDIRVQGGRMVCQLPLTLTGTTEIIGKPVEISDDLGDLCMAAAMLQGTLERHPFIRHFLCNAS